MIRLRWSLFLLPILLFAQTKVNRTFTGSTKIDRGLTNYARVNQSLDSRYNMIGKYEMTSKVSATNVFDASGYNGICTSSGAVSYVAGPRGTVAEFAYSLALLKIHNTATIQNITRANYTVSGWVFPNGTGVEEYYDFYPIFIRGATTSQPNEGITYGINTNPDLTFRLLHRTTAGTVYTLSAATTSATGVWHHVTGTVNTNGTMKIYLNGELSATGAFPSNILGYDWGATIWSIGNIRSLYWDEGFVGKMGDVRLYNRDLNADEIRKVYNGL